MDTQRTSKRVVQLAIALTTFTGAIVLLGWQFDITLIKQGFPDSPATMKANTALCFLLAGLSLAATQAKVHSNNATLTRWLKCLILSFTFLVFLISSLTLSQYLLGWNLGIDQLLVKDATPSATTLSPGRMAELTAINFLLTSIVLGLLYLKTERAIGVAQGLGVLILLITFLPLTGHVFGASPAYEVVLRTQSVANHTLVAFLALSGGILAICPDRGLMQIMTSPFVGGIIARRILPWALPVPLLLNWLTFLGEKHGWYNSAFGYAFRVFVMSGVIAVLVGWTAQSLNQLDHKRTQAKRSLQEANEMLERRVTERTADLQKMNDRLQIELIERERAEQALQESELKFRALFDQSFQFTGLLHPDGTLLELNQPTLDLIEEFGEVAIGRLFWDRAVWGAEGRIRLQAAITQALTGELVRLEMPLYALDGTLLQASDGSLVIHDITIKTAKNAAGQILFLIVEGRDISEQKRVETSFAQLAAIVESSDDAIISKNLDGIVTTWNKGAEKVFGYAAEEMIGQPLTRIVPSDRLNEIPIILQKIQQDESIEHYETVRLRKDGERIDISVTISPIKNAAGKVIGASAIKRDIRDRKQIEKTLRQYERIVAATTDAISLVDRNYQYRTANQAYLTWHQKTCTELIGHPVSAVVGQTLFESLN
ncbi:PAS domain S-box protein [Kovacikia minuta CCNUW1]|uniref:PAS domain S-box protein n=1 Tax=Kovacikia minuta TaxID=2931930 RepID=UPI001CCDE9FA|nr:PAS domain S-box protein [Kovacikia minuta]UBF26476.1 PAS domain S-box protein [Kovacikia minuta CCNUW1]